MKKVTYLIGAGASANALPIVSRLTDRFKFFCWHLTYFIKGTGGEPSDNLIERGELIKKIERFYTIDTYAKNLYLQNPNLNTNKEYDSLVKYLSAFFIYEQLNKKKGEKSTIPLFERNGNSMVNGFDEDKEQKIKDEILKDLDYRYDSFLASLLKYNEKGEIEMPKEINIVSWNYDSQFEKSYMNLTSCTYDAALERLNFIGVEDGKTLNPDKPAFIKLNGTAAFYRDGSSFGNLFDYKKHHLNEESVRIFKEILTSPRNNYETALRFAWVKSDAANKAIDTAQKVLQESDIIVVIGYTFPYFNREEDREIFKHVNLPLRGGPRTQGKYHKMYIQAPSDNIESIVKRFESIKPLAEVERFTEVDQFLIPNEL
ncbi:MAG TPA: hypothetical protein PK110_01590 [Niabella sp.]|jgi:hypothetical protein|nr:hypothetical protein [Niabella sp.]